jgi:hypothetical protein
MKTAVTEILEHCKELLSEGHQIHTQGLVDWIEDKLLEMEKQQIMDAYETAMETDIYTTPLKVGEQYYNETFKIE